MGDYHSGIRRSPPCFTYTRPGVDGRGGTELRQPWKDCEVVAELQFFGIRSSCWHIQKFMHDGKSVPYLRADKPFGQPATDVVTGYAGLCLIHSMCKNCTGAVKDSVAVAIGRILGDGQ